MATPLLTRIQEFHHSQHAHALPSNFIDAIISDDDGSIILFVQIDVKNQTFKGYGQTVISGDVLELEGVHSIFLMRHDEGAFYQEFCSVIYDEFLHHQAWSNQKSHPSKEELIEYDYTFLEAEFYAPSLTTDVIQKATIILDGLPVFGFAGAEGDHPFQMTQGYVMQHSICSEMIGFSITKLFKIFQNENNAITHVEFQHADGVEIRKYSVNQHVSGLTEDMLNVALGSELNTKSNDLNIERFLQSISFKTVFTHHCELNLPF